MQCSRSFDHYIVYHKIRYIVSCVEKHHFEVLKQTDDRIENMFLPMFPSEIISASCIENLKGKNR